MAKIPTMIKFEKKKEENSTFEYNVFVPLKTNVNDNKSLSNILELRKIKSLTYVGK